MKITVTRSFSKKIQIKEYEPVDSFACAQVEFDSEGMDLAAMQEASRTLDAFVREEVKTTILSLRTKPQSASPAPAIPAQPPPAPMPAKPTAPAPKPEPLANEGVMLSGDPEVDVVAVAGAIAKLTGQHVPAIIFEHSKFKSEKDGQEIGFRMPTGKSEKWVAATLSKLKKTLADHGLAAVAGEKVPF